MVPALTHKSDKQRNNTVGIDIIILIYLVTKKYKAKTTAKGSADLV